VRNRLGVLIALSLAACGQSESRQTTSTETASPAPAAPAAAATAEELSVLHTVATYYEFERQAIEARRSKSGGRYQLSFPGPSCVDSLVLRIARERASDVDELEDAVRALNSSMPDGSLDEDYKGYLGLAVENDGAFSAEQALIHGEVIGELRRFASAFPDSRIRPWADQTTLKLKDRLNEINPDVCANAGLPPTH
jgi:hypothetical protein